MSTQPDGGLETNPPEPPGRSLDSRWWVPATAGVLVGLALRFLYFGRPGESYNAMMGSFTLLAPVVVGAVTVYVAERTARRTWGYYFLSAAAANALFVLGTLIIMIEGLICAIIAVPLFSVMGGIAGLITGAVCRWTRWPKRAVYSVAALPLVFGAVEQHVPLPNAIQVSERSVVIEAPPEHIWAVLMTASHIQAREMDDGWMYRIGVPTPLSATTEQHGDQLVRHIRMGKAIHFDQVSDDWEQGRRVRWENRYAPDSFPAGALDDHVKIGGHHFDIVDTEYSLRDVPGGTQLRVRMRYRVSTHFNWYARPLAQLLVSNFEKTALEFYAQRATAGRDLRSAAR